jgi:hypothetical protein
MNSCFSFLFILYQNFFIAKFEHPALTDALVLSRERVGKPMKAHIFSNESDLFNRIVLGKSAKQFKAERGLDSDITSIRPDLSKEEINYIQKLQNIVIGLIMPD